MALRYWPRNSASPCSFMFSTINTSSGFKRDELVAHPELALALHGDEDFQTLMPVQRVAVPGREVECVDGERERRVELQEISPSRINQVVNLEVFKFQFSAYSQHRIGPVRLYPARECARLAYFSFSETRLVLPVSLLLGRVGRCRAATRPDRVNDSTRVPPRHGRRMSAQSHWNL